MSGETTKLWHYIICECAAFFQDNDKLLDWVNRQPLGEPITCLGDGHPEVWNLIAGISSFEQRLEILDWYHRCGKPVQIGWF